MSRANENCIQLEAAVPVRRARNSGEVLAKAIGGGAEDPILSQDGDQPWDIADFIALRHIDSRY